jgi:Skp family chaperone for outer membrane proteins
MTLTRLIACGLAAVLVAGAAAAQAGSVQTACAADFQKACPDAKPGPGGGRWQCVKGHLSEFSQPCQSAIADMKAKVQAKRAAAAAAGGSPTPAQAPAS